MKINVFYDFDRSSGLENVYDRSEALPESIQTEVISSFRKLLENPDFVAKLREEIATRWEAIDQRIANNTLDKMLVLEDQVTDVHMRTHTRLDYLMHAVAPDNQTSTASA